MPRHTWRRTPGSRPGRGGGCGRPWRCRRRPGRARIPRFFPFGTAVDVGDGSGSGEEQGDAGGDGGFLGHDEDSDGGESSGAGSGTGGEGLGGEDGGGGNGSLGVGGEAGEHDGTEGAADLAAAARELVAEAVGGAVEALLGGIGRDAERSRDFPDAEGAVKAE